MHYGYPPPYGYQNNSSPVVFIPVPAGQSPTGNDPQLLLAFHKERTKELKKELKLLKSKPAEDKKKDDAKKAAGPSVATLALLFMLAQPFIGTAYMMLFKAVLN